MPTEVLQMVCLGAGGGLFMLGGFRWKPWRRFVLPAVLGLAAWNAGYPPHLCSLMTYLLTRAFHYGYGDTTPWLLRFLVGVEYAVATLPLGLTWWQLILPPAWILLFTLSRWRPTYQDFFWKLVEFLTGAMIGTCVAVRIGAVSAGR